MSSVDSDLLDASLALHGDPAAAAARAQRILDLAPGHVEASLLLGAALRRLGNPGAAIPILEALVVAQPTSATMRMELAKTYSAAGRAADAVLALQQAVGLDDRFAEAWRELAALYFAAGEEVAGDQAYARYGALAPEPPELNDAMVALAGNRLRTAQAHLERRLMAAPGDITAMRLLADLDGRRNDLASAERRLLGCLQTAPGHAQARLDLVRVLRRRQKHDEALLHVERLLASQPHNAEYRDLKAQTLRFLGRHEEAIALTQELVDDDPENEEVWLHYGHLLREVGDPARSIEMYRRALRARPGSGSAYWSLANLKTFRFAPQDVSAMREAAAREAAHEAAARARGDGGNRVALEFALGKALEDDGKFAESFEHYALGNRLHRATIVHDADAVTADVRRSEAMYTERFFAERPHWGSASRAPIFIVGLPRSGSTLLEQMLSRHSEIEATEELTDIPSLTVELMTAASAQPAQYPLPVAALDEGQIAAHAQRYLADTARRRPAGKPRFIDKMLGNFGHIGLIHLLFPNAAIIDIRRQAMAGCFACYKQYFGQGMEYTYDLGELARYYADYAALTAHMDAVLPGRVHRVRYEKLVAEPETELRKVLAYCGLPFEEPCLRFHDGARVVRTISSEQVRQPLYTSGIDQWRHFEPWLGPLREALGGLGS